MDFERGNPKQAVGPPLIGSQKSMQSKQRRETESFKGWKAVQEGKVIQDAALRCIPPGQGAQAAIPSNRAECRNPSSFVRLTFTTIREPRYYLFHDRCHAMPQNVFH